MESYLRDLHLKHYIIYLDNIIIYSKSPSEHIKRLQGVFEKLAEAGLKLKSSKCDFFCNRLASLGHMVSAEAI